MPTLLDLTQMCRDGRRRRYSREILHQQLARDHDRGRIDSDRRAPAGAQMIPWGYWDAPLLLLGCLRSRPGSANENRFASRGHRSVGREPASHLEGPPEIQTGDNWVWEPESRRRNCTAAERHTNSLHWCSW